MRSEGCRLPSVLGRPTRITTLFTCLEPRPRPVHVPRPALGLNRPNYSSSARNREMRRRCGNSERSTSLHFFPDPVFPPTIAVRVSVRAGKCQNAQMCSTNPWNSRVAAHEEVQRLGKIPFFSFVWVAQHVNEAVTALSQSKVKVESKVSFGAPFGESAGAKNFWKKGDG